jgi:hypothetical protein
MIAWIIAHRGYLALCFYKIGAKEQDKKQFLSHLIYFHVLFGCIYKLVTTAVIIYKQDSHTLGVEVICFEMLDCCFFDIGYAILLMVLANILSSPLLDIRIQRLLTAAKVVICTIPIVSLLNGVYTIFVLAFTKEITTLGILMYTVTLPALFGLKFILIIFSVVFSVVILRMLSNSIDDKNTRLLVIKIVIVMVFSVISNICLGLGVILSYFLSTLALMVLYMIPCAILYAVIIIVFLPNASKWKVLFAKQEANKSVDAC